MRANTRFVISLILILLLSWGNVNYFGTFTRNRFPFAVNHAVHFAAFLLTWAIGAINWRRAEAWLRWLWNGAYLFVFIFLLALVFLYFYNPGLAPFRLTAAVFTMRNLFTGPFPFLVCYTLVRLAKKKTGPS